LGFSISRVKARICRPPLREALPTDAYLVYAIHVLECTVQAGGRSHGRTCITLLGLTRYLFLLFEAVRIRTRPHFSLYWCLCSGVSRCGPASALGGWGGVRCFVEVSLSSHLLSSISGRGASFNVRRLVPPLLALPRRRHPGFLSPLCPLPFFFFLFSSFFFLSFRPKSFL